MQTLYTAFGGTIETALSALVADGVLPQDTSFKNVTLEPPRDASHGDLATNAAMVLAKTAKTNPRALAEAIAARARQRAAEVLAGSGVSVDVMVIARDGAMLAHAR